MIALTINAELPAPVPVKQRKIFAFGLIHLKTYPQPGAESGSEDEMRVLGLMTVEDHTFEEPAGCFNPREG